MGNFNFPFMRWIPFAMVRIAVIFMAGILLGIYQSKLINETAAAILFVAGTIIYAVVRFSVHNVRLWSGVIGLSVVFVAGYWNALLRNESTRPDHLLNVREPILAYQVNLITSAEEKEKSWKRVASVQSIKTSLGWKSASGRINLYWPKSEAVSSLDFGDVLLITGAPQVVDGPFNPHEFDFKRFLAFRNIYHQQFVKKDEWMRIQESTDRGFLFYAQRARNWSVNTIKKFIASPREQGIVIALVLGVTDGLDNELLTAYATSGTMHVLAVSGLHVSILYGILLLLFKPFGKSVTALWVSALVSLLLLWGYAFITGLSASVLRAVAMFTFVVISKPIGRNTNIYNTLAASAFCLLLYDPFLIMSVGFQLSYLAVLGIVYLQRPIYNLWEVKSWFGDWAWQLCCVSIAAQISTLAISLLYFHQFPVYFLLANLFVIPASFVVLIGGIVLLIIPMLPTIAGWLGIFLEWFVKVMNAGIFLIEKFPLSLIDGLYITPFQAWLMAIFTLAVIILVQFRKFLALLVMGICTCLFSFASWRHLLNEVQKPNFYVYKVSGKSVFEWTSDATAFIFADSALVHDPKTFKFHIAPNHLSLGIRNTVLLSPVQVGGISLSRVKGRTFVWITRRDFRMPEKLTCDYLVIGGDAVPSLKAISKHIEFREVIFDSSNSYRYCERLRREALKLNIDAHAVLREGVFVKNL